MLFNSFNFVFFFLTVGHVTLLLNRAHKLQARNAFLLLSSYVFYGSFNIWSRSNHNLIFAINKLQRKL